MQKRGELEVRAIFEADEDDFDRMRQWLISTLKEAVRYSQKGMIAISVYNEDGEMVGHSVTGKPSPEAQEAIEVAFDTKKSA